MDNRTRSAARQEQESIVLLVAIKEITHEFIKFEQHFQVFKSDVGKTMDEAEKLFAAKLSTITQKIDHFGNRKNEHHCQLQQVDAQITTVDHKVTKLDKAFRLLEKDVQQQQEDVHGIMQVAKNVDNNARKNNLRIKGLKVGRS